MRTSAKQEMLARGNRSNPSFPMRRFWRVEKTASGATAVTLNKLGPGEVALWTFAPIVHDSILAISKFEWLTLTETLPVGYWETDGDDWRDWSNFELTLAIEPFVGQRDARGVVERLRGDR